MRFIAFGFDKWYPLGGAQDLIGLYPKIQDALDAVVSQNPLRDCYNVYDTELKTIVAKGCIVGLLPVGPESGSSDD